MWATCEPTDKINAYAQFVNLLKVPVLHDREVKLQTEQNLTHTHYCKDTLDV